MSYSVEYLKRLLKAVDNFEVRFADWMTTQVESDHNNSRGILPTVWPKGSARKVAHFGSWPSMAR